jgi:hypothetical protein
LTFLRSCQRRTTSPTQPYTPDLEHKFLAHHITGAAFLRLSPRLMSNAQGPLALPIATVSWLTDVQATYRCPEIRQFTRISEVAAWLQARLGPTQLQLPKVLDVLARSESYDFTTLTILWHAVQPTAPYGLMCDLANTHVFGRINTVPIPLAHPLRSLDVHGVNNAMSRLLGPAWTTGKHDDCFVKQAMSGPALWCVRAGTLCAPPFKLPVAWAWRIRQWVHTPAQETVAFYEEMEDSVELCAFLSRALKPISLPPSAWHSFVAAGINGRTLVRLLAGDPAPVPMDEGDKTRSHDIFPYPALGGSTMDPAVVDELPSPWRHFTGAPFHLPIGMAMALEEVAWLGKADRVPPNQAEVLAMRKLLEMEANAAAPAAAAASRVRSHPRAHLHASSAPTTASIPTTIRTSVAKPSMPLWPASQTQQGAARSSHLIVPGHDRLSVNIMQWILRESMAMEDETIRAVKLALATRGHHRVQECRRVLETTQGKRQEWDGILLCEDTGIVYLLESKHNMQRVRCMLVTFLFAWPTYLSCCRTDLPHQAAARCARLSQAAGTRARCRLPRSALGSHVRWRGMWRQLSTRAGAVCPAAWAACCVAGWPALPVPREPDGPVCRGSCPFLGAPGKHVGVLEYGCDNNSCRGAG